MPASDPNGDELAVEAVDAVLRIGERLAALRAQRGLKISDLARLISVSPSLISQIEGGHSRPSVATLFALAQQLDVSVDALFGPDAESSDAGGAAKPVVEHATARDLGEGLWPASRSLVDAERFLLKTTERQTIEIRGGVRWERLTRGDVPGVEFMELVYQPGAESDSELYRHPGTECVLVTVGQLDIHVGSDVHRVRAGDSIAFPSSLPHRYVNAAEDETRAVTVILHDS